METIIYYFYVLTNTLSLKQSNHLYEILHVPNPTHIWIYVTTCSRCGGVLVTYNGLSWNSQGHWPPCINLWNNPKKGIFFWKMEGNNNRIGTHIIPLSTLLVMLTYSTTMDPWIASTTWIRDVGRSSPSPSFTLHTLLLTMWLLGWSSQCCRQHFLPNNH